MPTPNAGDRLFDVHACHVWTRLVQNTLAVPFCPDASCGPMGPRRTDPSPSVFTRRQARQPAHISVTHPKPPTRRTQRSGAPPSWQAVTTDRPDLAAKNNERPRALTLRARSNAPHGLPRSDACKLTVNPPRCTSPPSPPSRTCSLPLRADAARWAWEGPALRSPASSERVARRSADTLCARRGPCAGAPLLVLRQNSRRARSEGTSHCPLFCARNARRPIGPQRDFFQTRVGCPFICGRLFAGRAFPHASLYFTPNTYWGQFLVRPSRRGSPPRDTHCTGRCAVGVRVEVSTPQSGPRNHAACRSSVENAWTPRSEPSARRSEPSQRCQERGVRASPVPASWPKHARCVFCSQVAHAGGFCQGPPSAGREDVEMACLVCPRLPEICGVVFRLLGGSSAPIPAGIAQFSTHVDRPLRKVADVGKNGPSGSAPMGEIACPAVDLPAI